MNRRPSMPTLQSVLAPWIEKFIAEKHACGYKYAVESEACAAWIVSSAIRDWKPSPCPGAVRPGSRRDRMKVPGPSGPGSGLVRRLALFLLRQGCPAYVPEVRLTAKEPSPYVPYIFRHDEIRRLLKRSHHPREPSFSPAASRPAGDRPRPLWVRPARPARSWPRVGEVNLTSVPWSFARRRTARIASFPWRLPSANTCGAMRTPWAPFPPMSPSSQPLAEGHISARRSTTPSANCSGDVGFLTEGEGAVLGFTDLRHNADSRIMPKVAPVIWSLGPSLGTCDLLRA